MSPKDAALCQQAIELANSGQTQAAYEQFCTIHSHGNSEDITLLYWLAVTTPKLKEAQYAIDTITRLEPDHPKLHELQSYIARKEELEKQRQRQEAEDERKRKEAEAYALQHPILTCPYCHAQAPAVIRSKVSTGGWVLFACLLTGLLVCLFVGLIIPIPIADFAGTGTFLGCVAVIGFPLCFLALLIQEKYRVCASCGIKLG